MGVKLRRQQTVNGKPGETGGAGRKGKRGSDLQKFKNTKIPLLFQVSSSRLRETKNSALLLPVSKLFGHEAVTLFEMNAYVAQRVSG